MSIRKAALSQRGQNLAEVKIIMGNGDGEESKHDTKD